MGKSDYSSKFCPRYKKVLNIDQSFQKHYANYSDNSRIHVNPIELEHEPRKQETSQFKSEIEGFYNNRLILIIVSILILFICVKYSYLYVSKSSDYVDRENSNLIKKLQGEFPSQKIETWHNFLSVLEKKIPTVKSIIFLHGTDRRTSDCLANRLVFLYDSNNITKSEDVTFSTFDFESRDYGFALEYYHKIVQKFRVFVTDLTKVSGNIARIFHSLCDEVSSDIKPSLFIFTLKYDKRTESLKPISRATEILREAWSDLPEYEIFPLLSRIIKNVVDIVPEKDEKC